MFRQRRFQLHFSRKSTSTGHQTIRWSSTQPGSPKQLIKQLYQSRNPEVTTQQITTQGWIQTIRSSKKFSFIELNDGSFPKNLQVVVDNQLISDKNSDSNSSGLVTGSSVEIQGNLTYFRHKKTGEELPEIQCEKLTLVGPSDGSFPIQKKFHTKEFLRELSHLRPRTKRFSSVMRVRSQATLEISKFFNRKNFVQIHTPIITSSDCEGSGDLFQLSKAPSDPTPNNRSQEHFFGKPAFLGVSGQLHAEAFACAMSRVYTFGPTFRAEASHTQQHLAEFWMIEPEIGFANLEDCIELARDLIVETTRGVFDSHQEDLDFLHSFNGEQETAESAEAQPPAAARELLHHFLNPESFQVITYTEAINLLEKHRASLQTPPSWEEGLPREHELYLVNHIFDGKPVFVTDYPVHQKPFYMKKNPDGKTVRCLDLLVPIVGEVAGGSEREDNYEVLLENMKEHQLGLKGEYDWYLDLRKYGSVPHAGFGIGFERYLQVLTGTRNIRDVVPVPRAYGTCQL